MRAEHRAMRDEFRRMRRMHRARRRYDDYRWWHGNDDITALEELQRDLEEAAADVAERVKRLRASEKRAPQEI